MQQIIQRTIASKVDRLMEKTFKTEHPQAAEEAPMNMLITGHAAPTDGPKDVSYGYIENTLTKKTLIGTLNDLFIRNPEWWS